LPEIIAGKDQIHSTHTTVSFLRLPDSKAVRFFIWGIIMISLVGIVWWISVFLPPGIDWERVLRPASLRMLSGESLYGGTDNFAYPPWALFLLLPLTLFPVTISRAILMLISISAFIYVAKKLGGKIPAIFFANFFSSSTSWIAQCKY